MEKDIEHVFDIIRVFMAHERLYKQIKSKPHNINSKQL